MRTECLPTIIKAIRRTGSVCLKRCGSARQSAGGRRPLRFLSAALCVTTPLLSFEAAQPSTVASVVESGPLHSCFKQDAVLPGPGGPSHNCNVTVYFRKTTVTIGKLVFCAVSGRVEVSCAGQPPLGGCHSAKSFTVGCETTGPVFVTGLCGHTIKVAPKDRDGNGPQKPPSWGEVAGAQPGAECPLDIVVPHPF